MVVWPVNTALFMLLYTAILHHAPTTTEGSAVVGIHFFTTVSVVTTWVGVERTDPCSDGGSRCSTILRGGTSSPFYCVHCQKRVPFYDHHCSWLNTCIATRNYAFFYFLALSGMVQHAIQAITLLMLLTDWIDTNEVNWFGSRGGIALASCGVILLVVSSLLLVAFGTLWFFHTYLRCLGVGTFDWIVRTAEAAENARHTRVALKKIKDGEIEQRRKREQENWRARRKEEEEKKHPRKADHGPLKGATEKAGGTMECAKKIDGHVGVELVSISPNGILLGE